MAAHLTYLKSRELVPSPEPLEASEDGEEPVDPREELIRRLLEYQKYKHAAVDLGNRPIEGRNVFVRGVVLEPAGEAGFAEHSVWKLLEHWAQILDKAKPQYTHDVVVDRMSITDRINQIVDLLESNKGMVRFEELLGLELPEAELRHKVVVSLLAVLELARLRVVRILQEEATGSFFLAQTDGANLSDARNLNVTSAKETEPAESEASPALVEGSGPGESGEAGEAGEAGEVDRAMDTAAEIIAADDAISEIDTLLTEEGESETSASPTIPETEPPLAETAGVAEADGAAEVMETSAENTTADTTKFETESLPGDTARLVPQEDVISAPSPASAETGEEVIDGQTQEEQKTPQE
jgi:segregation and condensation protein A